jgi:hypothetical protein
MLPTFLLAGVEKSGSSSLYRYLAQHPDIYMSPVKEPNYFSGVPLGPLSEYESLFDGATADQARGEASVGYFNDASTAARIRQVLPDATVLLMLRNPVERAYSHYNMLVIHGAAPSPPYLTVLERARATQSFDGTGVPTSRYADRLSAFMDAFGPNLHVHLYDDYRSDPIGTVQSIFAQLGVDPTFAPDTATSYNQSYRPRSSALSAAASGGGSASRFLRALLPAPARRWARSVVRRFNQQPVPPIEPAAHDLLLDVLRDDIDRTEALLGRDLSAWKQPAAAVRPH